MVSSGNSTEPINDTIMLAPEWDVTVIGQGQSWPAPTQRVVISGGTANDRQAIGQRYPQAQVLPIDSRDTIEMITEQLEKIGSINHLIWIASPNSIKSITEERLIKEQHRGVLQVFRLIKALLRLGYGAKELGLSLITVQAQPVLKKEMINPAHASVFGLIGSLAKEYQNWKLRIVDLEANTEGKEWPVNALFTLPFDPQGNPVAYRGGEWYRQKLIPADFTKARLDKKLYKTGGVYVVIGGAGGIGAAWSEYMIRTYQAQIVWLGRRPQDAAIQAKLDQLAGLGSIPLYITADAADQKSLEQAYQIIKEHYSRIDGIIHAAIVLLDRSLANMDEERFQASLAAKVEVSVRMAQVFQNEPLDFVMFFSSMQSFAKSPGQSNYASGCTFEDAFAHQLALEWSRPVKIINWGYWGSIGVVASAAYQERMAKAGVGSIEPPEAMAALETLLAGPLDQIAFMKTTNSSALEGINGEESVVVYPSSLATTLRNLSQKHYGSILSGLKNPEAASDSIMMPDPPIPLTVPETGVPYNEIDEFCYKLLWVQLHALGLFSESNLPIFEFKARIGLQNLYGRWLDESLTVLARRNYLHYNEKSDQIINYALIDTAAAWEEWDREKARWLDDPNLKAQVVLLEAALRALPQILTGKIRPLISSFPTPPWN